MITKLVKKYPSGTTIKDIEKEIREEQGYYTLVTIDESILILAKYKPNENDKLRHVHDTDSILKVCADFEVSAKIVKITGGDSWHEYAITIKKENDNNEVQ